MTTTGSNAQANPPAPRRSREPNQWMIWIPRIILPIGFIIVATVALATTNRTVADYLRSGLDPDMPIVGDFLNTLPPVAPDQPINFPHPVHLSAGMSCRHCHNYTETSPVAGLASAELCMQCHTVVKPDSPEIQKLANYYNSGTDIPWVRVYNVPDFVYFSHRMHIAAGLQCAACHGDMTKQIQTYQANTLNMGFCITCHRASQAPIECYTCHK